MNPTTDSKQAVQAVIEMDCTPANVCQVLTVLHERYEQWLIKSGIVDTMGTGLGRVRKAGERVKEYAEAS